MNIRKLYAIALDNYYFSVSADEAEQWQEEADRVYDICIQCGYKKEALRRIAENSYMES